MQSKVDELSVKPKGAETPVAELAVVVPTFNERDNIAEVVRRLEQCLRGEKLGSDFRGRRFGGRNGGARPGVRVAGSAGPLPSAHRPARAFLSMHRRDAGELRPVPRCD